MPKVAIDIDKKISEFEQSLKALKKKKADIEKRKLTNKVSIIIKAMNKNAEFSNELNELCKKHNIDLEPKAKKKVAK